MCFPQTFSCPFHFLLKRNYQLQIQSITIHPLLSKKPIFWNYIFSSSICCLFYAFAREFLCNPFRTPQLLCSIEKAVWKLAQSGPSTEANMYHYRFVYTSTFSLNGRISETKRDILDPLAPKWPQRIGLPFTLSWPHSTFSSSFGLFLERKHFFGVFQVTLILLVQAEGSFFPRSHFLRTIHFTYAPKNHKRSTKISMILVRCHTLRDFHKRSLFLRWL